ncbi:MAG: hypothetical protein LBL07_11685 [Tannerella sp.]|nr:hypothetical protein [Tannerella sp.]
MSPYILFPDAPRSKCHPIFCSRMLREANFTLHSVPGRSGKQMSPYILFPDTPGSKCHPTVCSRKFRKTVQFATGQEFSMRMVVLTGVLSAGFLQFSNAVLNLVNRTVHSF